MKMEGVALLHPPFSLPLLANTGHSNRNFVGCYRQVVGYLPAEKRSQRICLK